MIVVAPTESVAVIVSIYGATRYAVALSTVTTPEVALIVIPVTVGEIDHSLVPVPYVAINGLLYSARPLVVTSEVSPWLITIFGLTVMTIALLPTAPTESVAVTVS